jgi:glutamyl/glutaminyl-tRNA synthetase
LPVVISADAQDGQAHQDARIRAFAGRGNAAWWALMIRTRFAPSPTGYLHVGGARTALFNWLFARRHGGRFILRVEDTDAARNTEAARAAIYDGMRWLGLDWDEGPDIGGPHGPYQQSERGARHREWFERLQATGRLYPDGEAWRFRFERRPLTVPDQVAGPVVFDYANDANTPDMVVRRSDGSFVFHFVNVVDDIDMGITHVIRGDDHLSNTPKHIQLFEALGVPPPVFAHLPLILNPDGTKMSKRDTGAALGSYLDEGFVPAGVVNFLALLGWSPKDDTELMGRDELVARFELAGINRKSAVFDLEKCRWFSGQWLQRLPLDQAAAAAAPHLAKAGLPVAPGLDARILAVVREKVRTLAELPDWFRPFHDDQPEPDDETRAKAAADPGFAAIAALLRRTLASAPLFSADGLKPALHEAAAAAGHKPGKLMAALRLLVTGSARGPDLLPLLEIIGRDRALARIDGMVGKLKVEC